MSVRQRALLSLLAALVGVLTLTGCEPGAGGRTCDPDGISFGNANGCNGNVATAAEITGGAATRDQLEALAKSAGFTSWQARTMARIALAESSGIQQVGAQNPDGTYDRCYWQINDVHGYDRGRLIRDAGYCAGAAHDVYEAQGYNAWTKYRNGDYRQY